MTITGKTMRQSKIPSPAALASTATMLSVLAGVAPAVAATTTTSFNVGVTVVASCTIAATWTSSPQAALAAGPAMCRAPAGTGIVAPRPRITIEQDPTAGVTRVVFAF